MDIRNTNTLVKQLDEIRIGNIKLYMTIHQDIGERKLLCGIVGTKKKKQFKCTYDKRSLEGEEDQSIIYGGTKGKFKHLKGRMEMDRYPVAEMKLGRHAIQL